MNFTEALEQLKNASKTAEDLDNIKEAMNDSNDTSDKFFFTFNNSFFKKQIRKLQISRYVNDFRFLLVFWLLGSLVYQIITHKTNATLVFINLWLLFIMLLSFIWTLSIEKGYYINESKYKSWEADTLIKTYYVSVLLDARKGKIIGKVYEHAYAILEELSKDPAIDEKIKELKKQKNIDFDFLNKDITFLEKLEKQYENVNKV